MTERQQLGRIAQLCGRYGVLWHHCRRQSWCDGDPGVPDLILAGRNMVLLPELKSVGGREGAQLDWAHRLGAYSPVWRDSDFRSGAVEAAIAAISGRELSA